MNRAQRRELDDIDERLTEEDKSDRALVHAVSQAEWYKSRMRHSRVRYVASEAGALLLAGAATVLAALSAPAWITATVAALVTFLAGLRRIVSWHDDWLEASVARAKAIAEVAKYRLLPLDQRTQDRQEQLVAAIDALVVDETRAWGRRRRERARADATA